MGDRHGGRFARRGRALSPPRPQVDAHREVGFRWRATVFRCRGVVGRICPAGVRLRPTCRRTAGRPRPTDSRTPPPSAKASRHGARAKGFAPRRNTPLGEGFPTRHEGERICPRAGTLSSAKASRHGAKAKGFAPAQERSPRRRPPDTARRRKDLPRAGTLSSAKASRHGARAKGFAPRRNTLLGEGLPTRRTSERICPAGFAFAPRADEWRAALDRRTARKTPLRRGRTHSVRPLPSSFTKKNKTTP